MAELIFILGESGSGKTYSLRNLDPKKVGYIGIEEKILSFIDQADDWQVCNKEAGNLDKCNMAYANKNYSKVYDYIKWFVNKGKEIIIIDDMQYLMADEYFRRVFERGYDKYTEIGHNFYSLISFIKNKLDKMIRVYVLSHIDRKKTGNIGLKTIGEMVDKYLTPEGMSNFVIGVKKIDGEHKFVLRGNDEEPYKVVGNLFNGESVINNDLKILDDEIKKLLEKQYGLQSR